MTKVDVVILILGILSFLLWAVGKVMEANKEIEEVLRREKNG